MINIRLYCGIFHSTHIFLGAYFVQENRTLSVHPTCPLDLLKLAGVTFAWTALANMLPSQEGLLFLSGTWHPQNMTVSVVNISIPQARGLLVL